MQQLGVTAKRQGILQVNSRVTEHPLSFISKFVNIISTLALTTSAIYGHEFRIIIS